MRLITLLFRQRGRYCGNVLFNSLLDTHPSWLWSQACIAPFSAGFFFQFPTHRGLWVSTLSVILIPYK